jgi:hypothetical protein
MKISLITSLLTALLKLLTPEMIRGWLNAALDALETTIKNSENQYDDAVLPLIHTIRKLIAGE